MLKIAILVLMFGIGVPVAAVIGRFNARFRTVLFIAMAAFTCKYVALHIFPLPDWTGTARGYAFTMVDFFSLSLFLSMIGLRNLKFTWLPPGTWFYLIYVASSCLSLIRTEYPLQGGMELLKMFWMYIFFVAAYNHIRFTGNFWQMTYAVAGVVFFMFAEGVRQRYLGGIYQVYSTLPHQNSLGLYGILCSCFLFGVLLNEKMTSIQSAIVSAGFACASLLVYFTLSRGSLAALIGGLAITASATLLINGFTPKRTYLLLALGILGLTFALIALPRVIERMEKAPENSKLTRINLALAARRIADDYPLGVGMNCFSVYTSPLYDYAREQYDQGITVGNVTLGAIVETTYLLVAAECGWHTLGLLLLWYFVYWYICLRCMFLFRHKPCFGIAAGLFGGLSSNYLQSTLEWVLKQYCNFYLLMLAFAILAVMWKERPRRERSVKAR